MYSKDRLLIGGLILSLIMNAAALALVVAMGVKQEHSLQLIAIRLEAMHEVYQECKVKNLWFQRYRDQGKIVAVEGEAFDKLKQWEGELDDQRDQHNASR